MFAALIPVVTAFEICHVGFSLDGGGTSQPRFVFRAKLDLNLLSDVASYFILQDKDVGEVALVRLAPQVVIGTCIHQFRRDANALGIGSVENGS